MSVFLCVHLPSVRRISWNQLRREGSNQAMDWTEFFLIMITSMFISCGIIGMLFFDFYIGLIAFLLGVLIAFVAKRYG